MREDEEGREREMRREERGGKETIISSNHGAPHLGIQSCPGGWEMASLIRGVLCKHVNLSSDARHVQHACNLGAGNGDSLASQSSQNNEPQVQ